MDAMFIAKGLFQSILEYNSPEEQVECFYLFEKLNIMPPFTELYVAHM